MAITSHRWLGAPPVLIAACLWVGCSTTGPNVLHDPLLVVGSHPFEHEVYYIPADSDTSTYLAHIDSLYTVGKNRALMDYLTNEAKWKLWGLALPQKQTDSQLSAIAADIRHLESRPLAAGSGQARRHLINWVTRSPDITVTICQGVTGPLLNSESRYDSELLAPFILSSAAYKIENPDADELAVNVGGLEGALAAYHALIEQQGSRARDSFMESLADRSESGSLADFVRSGLAGC